MLRITSPIIMDFRGVFSEGGFIILMNFEHPIKNLNEGKKYYQITMRQSGRKPHRNRASVPLH